MVSRMLLTGMSMACRRFIATAITAVNSIKMSILNHRLLLLTPLPALVLLLLLMVVVVIVLLLLLAVVPVLLMTVLNLAKCCWVVLQQLTNQGDWEGTRLAGATPVCQVKVEFVSRAQGLGQLLRQMVILAVEQSLGLILNSAVVKESGAWG